MVYSIDTCTVLYIQGVPGYIILRVTITCSLVKCLNLIKDRRKKGVLLKGIILQYYPLLNIDFWTIHQGAFNEEDNLVTVSDSL